MILTILNNNNTHDSQNTFYDELFHYYSITIQIQFKLQNTNGYLIIIWWLNWDDENGYFRILARHSTWMTLFPSFISIDLVFHQIGGKMEHKHEREGIVTLTELNLMPVNSVIIPEEYQVHLVFSCFILG